MPKPASDQELFAALKSCQSNALTQLYDIYAKQMYSLALRILNNTQEAEDLIQEIFLGLWKNCSYDPQRGSLKTFLMVMVRSRSLDRLRSRKSLQSLIQREQQHSSTFSDSPMAEVVAQEKSERVKAAIAQLPESQRRAIELAYYEGFSQVEIAQSLSVSLGTVKSWFRLGFSKLRAALRDKV